MRASSLLLLAFALTGAPAAHAQEPPVRLEVAVGERGWLKAQVVAPAGSTADVGEAVDGAVRSVAVLPVPRGSTGRKRLTPWRCDRRLRTFFVTVTLPDGSTASARSAVRTPACDGRFRLGRVQGRTARGIDVEVIDEVGSGGASFEVCAARRDEALRCEQAELEAGQARLRVRLPVTTAGPHRLVVRTPGTPELRSRVVVRRRAGSFRVLATGDSMIQIIDGYLKQRLAPVGGVVRSDAHISTGITKPSMLDWVAHARRSARTVRPDATVVFLGANDGFGLPHPSRPGEVACCQAAWVRAYAARAERMMASYARGGRGTVLWLLLPAPSTPAFASVFRGVNAAVLRAAREHDDVRVLDLRRTFTPGGRFRRTIRHRGRTVGVRQDDGVHLNVAGASIAADLIIRELRREGFGR